MNQNNCGVYVSGLTEDSPLKSLDPIGKQILSIENEKVQNIADVTRIMSTIKDNSEVVIDLDGEIYSVSPMYDTDRESYILGVILQKSCGT